MGSKKWIITSNRMKFLTQIGWIPSGPEEVLLLICAVLPLYLDTPFIITEISIYVCFKSSMEFNSFTEMINWNNFVYYYFGKIIQRFNCLPNINNFTNIIYRCYATIILPLGNRGNMATLISKSCIVVRVYMSRWREMHVAIFPY